MATLEFFRKKYDGIPLSNKVKKRSLTDVEVKKTSS